MVASELSAVGSTGVGRALAASALAVGIAIATLIFVPPLLVDAEALVLRDEAGEPLEVDGVVVPDSQQRQRALEEARRTVLQTGLAAVVGLTGYLTWRRVKATEQRAAASVYQSAAANRNAEAANRNAEAANRNAEASNRTADAANRTADAATRQAAAAEQGQITDRFTRAIEQLGSERMEIQLGGIYSLARIGQDSEVDRATTLEVLAAFVRAHPRGSIDEPVSVPIHTALRVLSERMDDSPRPDLSRVDLRSADLSGSRLHSVDLRSSLLAGADLSGCDLTDADLSGADLVGANLRGAILVNAFLHDADLTEANLWNANLDGVQAVDSLFKDADFIYGTAKGANFQSASFENGSLQGSDLSSASLGSAKLLAVSLYETNLSNANLRNADLTDVREYYFEAGRDGCAILDNVSWNDDTVWPVGFEPSEDQFELEVEG